jgi:hypothetical protein
VEQEGRRNARSVAASALRSPLVVVETFRAVKIRGMPSFPCFPLLLNTAAIGTFAVRCCA